MHVIRDLSYWARRKFENYFMRIKFRQLWRQRPCSKFVIQVCSSKGVGGIDARSALPGCIWKPACAMEAACQCFCCSRPFILCFRFQDSWISSFCYNVHIGIAGLLYVSVLASLLFSLSSYLSLPLPHFSLSLSLSLSHWVYVESAKVKSVLCLSSAFVPIRIWENLCVHVSSPLNVNKF